MDDRMMILQSLYDGFPSTQTLCNYVNVRKTLLTLFVNDDSPTKRMINSYCKISNNTIHDPSEQAKWCIDNKSDFSDLAEEFRHMRNKLVHNAVILSEDICHVLKKTIVFGKICSNSLNCDTMEHFSRFVDMLITACGKIISSENNHKKIISTTSSLDVATISIDRKSTHSSPPLPLIYFESIGLKDRLLNTRIKVYNGEHKNVKGQITCWDDESVRVTIDDNNTILLEKSTCVITLENSLNLSIIVTDSSALNKSEIFKIKDIKDSGVNMNGVRIKIMNGHHSGCNAVFRTWSGTAFTVDIDNVGRKSLRMSNTKISFI